MSRLFRPEASTWARLPTTGLAGALILAGTLAASVAAQQPPEDSGVNVLSARDTLRISRVASPTFSPTGDWVLYTRDARAVGGDIEKDEDLENRTHIWRVRSDGSGNRQMTHGKEDASQPQWLPDGERFAFLSSRPSGSARNRDRDPGDDDNGGPRSQVFYMYRDGGEAWAVSDHEEGVQSYRVSPDGKHIAFLARDPLGKEKKAKNKKKDDTVVVDEEFRWTHLWIWDVDKEAGRRLTSGDFTVSDPRWSPGSEHLAYVTRPTTKNDDGWNSDVWVIAAAGGEPRKLFENGGSDSAPRWSPDGTTIAFASKPHLKTNTWYSKLYLIAAGGGEPRVLLDDFDRDFSSPIWSPDSDRIYWATGDRTSTGLFSVDVGSGEVTSLPVPEGGNFSFELAPDGRGWTWIHSAADWPPEIYAAGPGLSDSSRLSDANPWLRDEDVALGAVRVVSWQNSDGEEIEGVLTLPVGYSEGESYPFILNPHGGPSGAVTASFNPTNQFFAGNGFMVLQPNFRGSSNYGQTFLNANRNYWGLRDYDDCMTGVDHAIARGWADPDRLIAYGWSYGGYMSFWIATQTDRFQLVSPGAGLSNLYSMYSTTDISNYLGWFFGTPWDNEDIYRRLSPIRHAKNVKSKVLIMTGAEDVRVPPEQSIEFYRALRDLDKEVSLVVFPREGHGIREPYHQMDRLRRYLYAFSDAVGLEPVSERAWEASQREAEGERAEDTETELQNRR